MSESNRSRGITIADIERALLNGGDLSALSPALASASGGAAETGITRIGIPVALPQAAALLEPLDGELAGLVGDWEKGKKSGFQPAEGADIVTAGVALSGRHAASHIESLIAEIKPDCIALDVSPSFFSAAWLYALGAPAGAGLPIHGEIRDLKNGKLYNSAAFYPGNACQTAILECLYKGTPLVPAGITGKPVRTMPGMPDDEMPRPDLTEIYSVFDSLLDEAEAAGQPSVLETNKLICSKISGWLKADVNSRQIKEAGYTASRIMDLAARITGKKILALVDVRHHEHVKYALDLLLQGIDDEVYFAPGKGYAPSAFFAAYSEKLAGEAKGRTPEKSVFQERFEKALAEFCQARENEALPADEVDRAAASIAARTRHHPEITHGASVRGSIALKEVLHGYGDLEGGITWGSLRKAAQVAIAPRISTRHGDDSSSLAVVEDIVKEITYGIGFYPSAAHISLLDDMDWMSPQDLMDALSNMVSGEAGDKPGTSESESGDNIMSISDAPQQMTGAPEYSDPYMNIRGNDRAGSAAGAIQRMMDILDEKLARGELTPEQHQREKQKLRSMLDAADYLASPAGGREMAKTVFELMDAQDKHWGKKLNFEDMHVYYHIKGTSGNAELSPPKQGYHRLRVLVDALEREGLIQESLKEKTFSLTGEALSMLMEMMLPRLKRGRELTDVLTGGKTTPGDVKYDIQRYSPGNTYRDISVRHTMRQIARNRRKPEEIQKRDLRVYLRKPRKTQSDIVLCIDTSGSMGFRHKLTYARLAAAALVKNAIERGDRVGIADFDDLGQALVPLDAGKNELISCIASINAGGNTNIGDGIKTAASMLLRYPGQNSKHIILVTDGLPSAVSREAVDRLGGIGQRDLTEDYAILETRVAALKGIRTSVIHIVDENESGGDFIKAVARTGNGEISRVRNPADLRLVVV